MLVPLFILFTDVKNIRFNFVNTDKPSRQKAKLSEKALNSLVFDQLARNNLLTMSTL